MPRAESTACRLDMIETPFSALWRFLRATYLPARFHALLRHGQFWNCRKLFVAEVGPKGFGLVTRIARRKGQLVFVAAGRTRVAHFVGQECFLYPDWYGVDRDTWIDVKAPYRYLNHSCDPNLGIHGARAFHALRDIEAGEELTFDYSITQDEQDWWMECKCGAPNCRKMIGAIAHLNRDELGLSLPYVPVYFRRHFERFRGGRDTIEETPPTAHAAE